MKKDPIIPMRFMRVLIFVMLPTLAACQTTGFQGNAYVREADGGIGPKIEGVSITFDREDGTITRNRLTNQAGWYRVSLPPARYRVAASHPIYKPYNSAPGFFVVTGNGYQTGNIFLNRLAATVVIIVRHAEKATTADNTDIDPDTDGVGVGITRAAALTDSTAYLGVEAIFSTAYCRTAQTAQPTASDLGLPLQVISTSNPNAGLDNCDPSVTVPTVALPASLANTNTMASHLLTQYTGKVVLVVGHSNTVPQLITALGAPSPCPVYLPSVGNSCLIPEDQFHHLFVVTVPLDGSTPFLTHQTYGAS